VIELVGLAAFLKIVERTEADRLLRRLPSGVGGEQDHLGVGRLGFHRPQHVEPIPVRHPKVGDDDIEHVFADALRAGGDTVGLDHAVAALA